MNTNVFSEIQGKSVFIEEMLLFLSDGQLQMRWTALCGGRSYLMIFHNASRVSLDDLSYPMQISELSIVCNRENGWDPDSRYLIHDYEDQRIRFYCEDFEMTNAEEL